MTPSGVLAVGLPGALAVYAAVTASVVLVAWVSFISIERPLKEWTKKTLGGGPLGIHAPARAIATAPPA